jgi:2,4-dienoyl-CoA reductase-like NADH-dependent reductase (Old Yellow Enzyme family)
MSALFPPITVKHLTFRNRVVMPPMVYAVMPDLSDHAAVEGVVSDASIAHYARRAEAPRIRGPVRRQAWQGRPRAGRLVAS